MTERLEAQVGWAGYTDVERRGRSIDGYQDPSVTLKYQLTEDDAAVALGAFGGITLPVGSDEFSSDEVDAQAGLAWSWAPADGPGLFGTVVASSLTSDDERQTELGASLGAGFSLGPALGAYLEYFGVFSDDGGPAHSINGGLTWLASDDVQLDLFVGGGLNGRADDVFAGAGVAWRL